MDKLSEILFEKILQNLSSNHKLDEAQNRESPTGIARDAEIAVEEHHPDANLYSTREMARIHERHAKNATSTAERDAHNQAAKAHRAHEATRSPDHPLGNTDTQIAAHKATIKAFRLTK